MRGKENNRLWNTQISRITPAYAGKRNSCGARKDQLRDHPRVCGEKVVVVVVETVEKGSPPRMRGKVAALMPANALIGITPAYAGKREL